MIDKLNSISLSVWGVLLIFVGALMSIFGQHDAANLVLGSGMTLIQIHPTQIPTNYFKAG